MSKSKSRTVQGIRIYPIDYLINSELSESDINNLLDTNSLLYSIIIDMHKYVGCNKRSIDIIKNINKNNKWLSSYKWSNKERSIFEQRLAKALKNIYYISDYIALQKAQWYMMLYGFDLK